METLEREAERRNSHMEQVWGKYPICGSGEWALENAVLNTCLLVKKLGSACFFRSESNLCSCLLQAVYLVFVNSTRCELFC